jgi:predicted DNA repair protein MutK
MVPKALAPATFDRAERVSMASGLFALLDDVAAIAKLAAASLDDIGAAAGKAGSKAIGVVVDDAAVTPGYAMGFTPERELPIVWKIAVGSLRNKFLFLLPGALLLSAFAPWAVTPLLMVGGAYLCFEATEKVIEAFGHHDEVIVVDELALSSEEMEAQKVGGAIRTDFILSAEIMAIALNEVADRSIALQAGALALVALGITLAVYGVVGFLVKMDDVGLHLAERRRASVQAVGRALVGAMPVIMGGLSKVGTAAMLWVGGGILVHGLAHFGLDELEHLIEIPAHAAAGVPLLGPALGWLVTVVASAMVALIVGGVIAAVMHLLPKRQKAAAPNTPPS